MFHYVVMFLSPDSSARVPDCTPPLVVVLEILISGRWTWLFLTRTLRRYQHLEPTRLSRSLLALARWFQYDKFDEEQFTNFDSPTLPIQPRHPKSIHVEHGLELQIQIYDAHVCIHLPPANHESSVTVSTSLVCYWPSDVRLIIPQIFTVLVVGGRSGIKVGD